MRLFTDQDVYGSTIALLRSQPHDVQTAREAGLSNAPDHELLRLLAEHTEAELHSLFIVIEPNRNRIRRLP